MAARQSKAYWESSRAISQVGLCGHNWNITKLFVAFITMLINQPGHKFAHVTTAQLSWHVQICEPIWSLLSK